MKTAEQWATRVQNSKEPWAQLVAEIQQDARRAALEEAHKAFLDEFNDAMRNGLSAHEAASCGAQAILAAMQKEQS